MGGNDCYLVNKEKSGNPGFDVLNVCVAMFHMIFHEHDRNSPLRSVSNEIYTS